MAWYKLVISILLLVPKVVLGNEKCSLPPFKEEAKTVLKMFGFSDSCTSSALEWCEHGCDKDFPSALRESAESIVEAASTLEKALNSLRSLSDCLKNEKTVVEAPPETTTPEYIPIITTTTEGMTPTTTNEIRPPTFCEEVKLIGDTESGVRTIYPFSCCPEKPVSVYCDQSVDGGGWTVIQRRENLPVRENFYRNWTDYVNGFGDLNGEFWLGLDNIHELTSASKVILRIEMENKEGRRKYAEYNNFEVGDASSKYILLSVGKYRGNAGDSLSVHRGSKFTTHDSDNDNHEDTNCAAAYKGAWWYTACHNSNLNGFPHVGTTSSYADGIVWETWLGFHYSLSKVQMMIRPKILVAK